MSFKNLFLFNFFKKGEKKTLCDQFIYYLFKDFILILCGYKHFPTKKIAFSGLFYLIDYSSVFIYKIVSNLISIYIE